jgi:hypothetical protein
MKLLRYFIIMTRPLLTILLFLLPLSSTFGQTTVKWAPNHRGSGGEAELSEKRIVVKICQPSKHPSLLPLLDL